MPTNYQSLSTCACIGENLAVRLPVVLERVEIPLLSTAEVDLHLGGGSSWEQRRAFEWGLLAGVSRRNGEDETARYCHSRIDLLKGHRERLESWTGADVRQADRRLVGG